LHWFRRHRNRERLVPATPASGWTRWASVVLLER
jgi:hypothetical protein